MYQISTDAQIELQQRAQADLAAQLRAEGIMDALGALQVWQDSQEAFIEGCKSRGEWENYYDRYQDCEDATADAIKEETQSDAPIGTDGARVATWQGRDGWYWTIISPDGIEYDDDHGPYESRDAAREAIEDAQEA